MKSKILIWLTAGILCFVVLAQGVQAAETYHYVTQWGSVGTGDGQFTAPHGIAINSSGYVYVSDPSLDQNRIQIFTDQGSFVGKWGQSGAINGRFDGPYGIAVNSSHSVYVVDHYNDRIQIFTPDGTYREQWPVPLSPYDIAVDSAGFTYVSEDYNDRIMIFSPTGTSLGYWGSTGSGNGQFQHPYGVAVDPSGNIYVSDIELNRIQKFTLNGSYLTQWGSAGAGDGQFASPQGIAVDHLGNVYVADTGNNRIQKFTSGGSYLTQLGSAGAGDGQFASPQGVAVDHLGNVYVVDSGNTRIQKFARAAVTYLVENYLGNNPEGNGNQELLVSNTIVPSGTVVTLLDGTKITSPAYPTWLGFVNEAKNDNWGHPCEIVFYSDDHDAVEIQSMMPPTGIDLSHAAGKAPDAVGRTSILPPFNKDPNCVPDPTHNYALLISGGGIQSTNYARYYNDIKFLYTTLVNDYHYPKTHIRVVMSDGTSSANDQVTFDKQNNAVPANSKPDLNGDGVNDVDYSATRANVIAALNSFMPLTASDNLLIFTTGHGISNTANPDPNTNQVDLLLWGAGEKISDRDFVIYLPANPKISLVMEQCDGGGFKDNFIVTGKTRMLATAATGIQSSHSNDFSYFWITGVAGHDSVSPTPNPANADTGDNGQVSVKEAYTYANYNDPSGPYGAKVENPVYAEYATGAGITQHFSACTNPYSITVATPGSSWARASAHTVTWTSTLPANTNVKVQLRKGAKPGLWQADISKSTLATLKSAGPWTVPGTLPGGAGTDYWIKVSTIGSLSPPITGNSGNFGITGVTASPTGTLTINSNPSGALIDIKDSAGNPVSIGGVQQTGFSTPHTFSGIASGAYFVKVTKSCYWPMNSASITVLGTQTFTYPLIAQPTGVCGNAPSGSIAITSLPEEGYQVFIDGISMGYNTPVLQEIGIGPHDVRLEMPGYQSKTITVHVVAGELARADFILQPIPDVNAKVLILPQPLNIGKTGYFLAFVKLPTGYRAADVIEGSVSCEGAPALRIIRIKIFPQIFAAIFKRQDLQTVQPGDPVKMSLVGAVRKNGGNVLFRGSDNVKVIGKPLSIKEDVDNAMTMTDTQIFTKFYKF